MERPSAEAPRRRRWGPPVADLPVTTTPPAEAAPGDAPGTGRESTDHARLADPRTANSRDGGASTREGPATTTAPQSSGRPADEPTECTTASREKRRRRSRWDAPGDADAVAPGAVVPTSPRAHFATPRRVARRDAEFDIDVDTSKKAADARQKPHDTTPHAGTLLLPGGVLAKLPVSFLCERDAPPDADEATRGAFAALARINRAAIEETSETSPPRPRDRDLTRRAEETEEDETRQTRRDGSRSPSPEPVYGRDGARVNTRAARAARKREAARAEALETVARLCASSPASASFRFPESYAPPRKTRKIFVPADAHPGYNFFGLIVGPRGNTQKQMQREFGVKIVIRGAGSEKKTPAETAFASSRAGEEEPMHVLVTGDDDASVDAAAAAVARLLEPLRDEENEHKRAQLRELAVLNGTLREDGGARGARGGDDDVGAAALPPEIRARVAAQYERDAARLTTTRGETRGGDLSVGDDAAYRAFLEEVGVEAAPSSARRAGADEASASAASDRRKTYVGRLPSFANEHTVALTFRPFGAIEKVEVVPDRDTNAPCRGFAFVLFAEESAARAAATYFANVASAFPHPPPPGFARADRAMDVRVKADPRPPPRGDASTGVPHRSEKRNESADPRCRLYVAKLAPTFSSEALKSRVAASLAEDVEAAEDAPGDPAIVSCDVVADRVTGLGRGFAFVRMRDARLAARVVAALDGAEVEGRAIVVRVAEDKRRRERPEGAAGRVEASGVPVHGGGYASPLDPYARPGVYANPYAHYAPRAVAAAEAAVAAANPALAAAAAAEMAARAADPAFATGAFYSPPHLRGGFPAGAAVSRPATAATAAPAAPGDLAEAPPPPPS